jgi:hypothetical protein
MHAVQNSAISSCSSVALRGATILPCSLYALYFTSAKYFKQNSKVFIKYYCITLEEALHYVHKVKRAKEPEMQEHAKPQNVWERELLEASEAQLDRTMDAAKAGDMDAFRQGLRDLDTIHDTAKRFDVSVATLAWNARS